MKQQTAIQKCLSDWLENREAKKTDILNTIKELEKLEEIKPFNYSQWEIEMANLRRLRVWKECIDWFITSLEYHESTYGSKGSDVMTPENHIGVLSEAIRKETTSSQTEISDEEIEKAVNNPMHDAYDFREGAKWYREQLKQL